MLVFEPGQFEAFAEEAFIHRMRQVLAALSAEETTPRLAISRNEIAVQLQHARKNGFSEERDCARWVLCAWCMGPDFDTKIASIAELLRRDDVGAAYKALALETILRAVFAALANQSRKVL